MVRADLLKCWNPHYWPRDEVHAWLEEFEHWEQDPPAWFEDHEGLNWCAMMLERHVSWLPERVRERVAAERIEQGSSGVLRWATQATTRSSGAPRPSDEATAVGGLPSRA